MKAAQLTLPQAMTAFLVGSASFVRTTTPVPITDSENPCFKAVQSC